jgi:hypothetical protein
VNYPRETHGRRFLAIPVVLGRGWDVNPPAWPETQEETLTPMSMTGDADVGGASIRAPGADAPVGSPRLRHGAGT